MIAAQMGHPSQFVEFKTRPGVPSELQSSVSCTFGQDDMKTRLDQIEVMLSEMKNENDQLRSKTTDIRTMIFIYLTVGRFDVSRSFRKSHRFPRISLL